ncbi:MAG: S-adenosylmethionine:tRNA ribosyltransferase-isomerase, partial [Sulfobacillus sp.]|nr:S-adenosylmethionine:tRNA ribosyltransferase-isomerase [Sulfobacillus sp.]
DPALSDRNGSVAILSRLGDLMALGRVVRRFHPESRLWVIDTDRDWYELAPLVGDPIRYGYVDRPYPLYYYQTIFGRVPGSAEMPSAGRPFTYEIVARMVERGVILCPITLHTSVSSHEVTQGLERYPVLPEYYHIPRRTVRHITEARRDGRRVIALGTTVVRALETWATSGFGRRRGWTRHLVTPNNPPRVVSNLVTGLHDNFSSHLALLYAFVDPPFLREAYRQAGLAGFRWHEFGDLSFIV